MDVPTAGVALVFLLPGIFPMLYRLNQLNPDANLSHGSRPDSNQPPIPYAIKSSVPHPTLCTLIISTLPYALQTDGPTILAHSHASSQPKHSHSCLPPTSAPPPRNALPRFQAVHLPEPSLSTSDEEASHLPPVFAEVSEWSASLPRNGASLLIPLALAATHGTRETRRLIA